MKEELYKKAKSARSADELKSLASAEGMDMTDEQAAAYYEHLHKSGEMSDEELENVAGGGCNAKDGRLVVTVMHACDNWACKYCGSPDLNAWNDVGPPYSRIHKCAYNAKELGWGSLCRNCKFMSYEKGLWLCNNPANRG